MADKNEIKRYRQNLRTEQDAIALYQRLAKAEKNPLLSSVYSKLIDTERNHADFWKKKLADAGVEAPDFAPSWRTRIFGLMAKMLGVSFVLPSIAAIEKDAASGYKGQADAEAAHMPKDEKSHARVFEYLSKSSGGVSGSDLARFEGRHKGGGGNALRAAVLGANDGLVSVFCLVMGVAGAGMQTNQILLTGFAGLLAGALSMSLGEWLSVQSSRELYEYQIRIEKAELDEIPEEEVEELALIYQAKGIEPESAKKLAERLITDPESALDTLAREELGIDPEELGGSAWIAALTSFCLFAIGALIPVLPYVFFSGQKGILASAVSSTVGLFLIGALITLLTGKNPFFSGIRMVIFGLATAAVTFGVGLLIGGEFRL